MPHDDDDVYYSNDDNDDDDIYYSNDDDDDDDVYYSNHYLTHDYFPPLHLTQISEFLKTELLLSNRLLKELYTLLAPLSA